MQYDYDLLSELFNMDAKMYNIDNAAAKDLGGDYLTAKQFNDFTLTTCGLDIPPYEVQRVLLDSKDRAVCVVNGFKEVATMRRSHGLYVECTAHEPLETFRLMVIGLNDLGVPVVFYHEDCYNRALAIAGKHSLDVDNKFYLYDRKRERFGKMREAVVLLMTDRPEVSEIHSEFKDCTVIRYTGDGLHVKNVLTNYHVVATYTPMSHAGINVLIDQFVFISGE